MTNHAIIALERVRDELSDDRRGLPRFTRSYQRPAPRSVTPHHSRRHAARLLGANRNQRNSSRPSLSSPRPEELAQTKSKSKFFAYTVSKSWKHGVRAPQQGASGLLVRGRGSDRAAARATRTRAAVLQSCGGKSSSGHWQWPAAQPPLRQLLRPRSRVLTQVHFSPPAPPRVSRRVQPQPTEIWRATAGDGKGESACRVCAE